MLVHTSKLSPSRGFFLRRGREGVDTVFAVDWLWDNHNLSSELCQVFLKIYQHFVTLFIHPG